jgi:hypothetical protein
MFLVLEIRTLYRQRSEDQETDRSKRVEEDNRFAGLLREQQESFAHVLEQNQRDFDATMSETKGSAGYVYFFALARETGPLPVMMVSNNKEPIRDVNLEIINAPANGSLEELQKYAASVFNPRLVHIGDVSPGFKTAPFILEPGRYEIRVMTRLSMFTERLEALRGQTVEGGWHEDYCLAKANSSKVLQGKCDHPEFSPLIPHRT